MKKKYSAPCEECGGRCCGYIAIELDRPRGKRDYDMLRWYLAHRDVNVFIDHDKNWHVEFRTPCEFQEHDKKCSIYSVRPEICRGHGTSEGSCEFYDTPYKEYFSTCDELEAYLDSKDVNWKIMYKN